MVCALGQIKLKFEFPNNLILTNLCLQLYYPLRKEVGNMAQEEKRIVTPMIDAWYGYFDNVEKQCVNKEIA